MKTLDTESEKINKICEVLRKDTLEPAEKEAAFILAEAQKKAEEMLRGAEKEAKKIVEKAKDRGHQEKQVFESSLSQGVKQSLELLKQEIENIFNAKLSHLIDSKLKNANVVAEIIEALIQAVKKEGIVSPLVAYIPSHLTKEEVNHLLLLETVKQLKHHSVEVGHFNGGAQLKLIAKNVTLDMSEEALKELLSGFVRPDFRKYFFNG